MRLTRFLVMVSVAGLFAVLLTRSAPAQTPPGLLPLDNDLERIARTEPSQRSEHRLKLGGVIDEVLVKAGDKVKAGQLLMKQDTRVEQAEVNMYKVLFDASVIDIDAARTKHQQAKTEFGRWEKLYNDGMAASVLEYEKSKLEVELTGLEIKKAEYEKQKNEAQYLRAKAVLDAMELRAKFDGVVERIDAKVGEVIDYQKPAVTIVNNDPLWIQFMPKSSVSLNLRVGQELDVHYAADNAPRKAKIIFISPVVEAGSDRHLVRLEMPNPEGKPSGLQVRVTVPSSLAQQGAATAQ